MDTETFKRVYNEVRNGCNKFYRHPLVRSFAYTDGVKDLADCGCHWLLDILSTELPTEFVKNAQVSNSCIVKTHVYQGKANITAEFCDEVKAWEKSIPWTDLPDGTWSLYIADEGASDARYRCILLSEY